MKYTAIGKFIGISILLFSFTTASQAREFKVIDEYNNSGAIYYVVECDNSSTIKTKISGSFLSVETGRQCPTFKSNIKESGLTASLNDACKCSLEEQ